MDRITSDVNICGGRPRIRDTRIRVVDILELISNKCSFMDIIEEFPELSEEDIVAAIEYAEERVEHALLS